MSILTLVRHGQASFLSDDYDRLSPLGQEQARRLGAYWNAAGTSFDAVYYGPRQRQIATGEIVRQCSGEEWPAATVVDALDEYQAEELVRYCLPQIAALDPRLAELASSFEQAAPEERPRAFERLFQGITRRWVSGEIDPAGVESWPGFRGRVHRALANILSTANGGRRIVVFTSAGPIATAVQMALGLTDPKTLELSWMMRNASFTEFLFSGDRFSLSCFNTHPHLDGPDLITYR
jgi:broad specificity phosphatase PhoE